MNKREQLYGELKERLVACDPGTPFLTVRSIMDDFEVSQATVSGAIQKLAEEGLLRKNGRRSMESPRRCFATAGMRSRFTAWRFRSGRRIT